MTKTKKKKQVKSQFDSLLKIHKDRYKYAEEVDDKPGMFSASVEILRIERLIEEELAKQKKTDVDKRSKGELK